MAEQEKGLVEIIAELNQRVKSLEQEVASMRTKYYSVLHQSDMDSVAEKVEQVLAQKIRAQFQKR